MTRPCPPFRLAFLAVALLSACAAADGATGGEAGYAPSPSNAFGAYLAGRFATSESDTRTAAESLLAALRADPDQPEVVQRAFIATLLDGRPEAVRLARRLPDNPLASMLIAGTDAQAGRWDRAEQRIRTLPRQGAAQLLQPMLLAWTLHVGASGEGSPALADVDRDGVLDVVLGTTAGELHVLDGATGESLPGFPVATDPLPVHADDPGSGFGSGAVAIPREAIGGSVAADDLDGDGRVEIVAASAEGRLYVWSDTGARRAGFPVTTDPALSDPSERDRLNADLLLDTAFDGGAPVGRLEQAVCEDFEDLAQCSAASVLDHLQAGRAPVALIAQDRVLLRRVRALLERQGLGIKDETGWTLATTAPAAQLMALLRAARREATVDEWLAWLKTPLAASLREHGGSASLSALESHCRKRGWSSPRRCATPPGTSLPRAPVATRASRCSRRRWSPCSGRRWRCGSASAWSATGASPNGA